MILKIQAKSGHTFIFALEKEKFEELSAWCRAYLSGNWHLSPSLPDCNRRTVIIGMIYLHGGMDNLRFRMRWL